MPIAQSQSISVLQDTALEIGLVANDEDQLIYRIVQQPSNGVLSGIPPDLSYMPIAGFVGEDLFTFVANDGLVDSNEAIVTVDVTASNLDEIPEVLALELPPDPGAVGNSSIEGIDSDADGVRDDVQRFIIAMDYDSTEKIRAVRQTVIAKQNILMFGAGVSEESIQEIGGEAWRAGACMFQVFRFQFEEELALLTAIVVNTIERSTANNAFGEQSIAVNYDFGEGDVCD